MDNRSRSPSFASTLVLEPQSHRTSNEVRHDNKLAIEGQVNTDLTNDSNIVYEDITFDTEIDVPADLRDGAIQAPCLAKFSSPFQWSATRKNTCLFLSCASTFIAAYSAGSYSIASVPIRREFHVSDEVFELGITLWCVAFASSPMMLAPISEVWGRRPVFLFSGFLFFVAQIGCSVTQSFAGMLICRLLVGAGASTFATIIGGVISDVYHAEDRNAPMALYSAGALAGTGMGPLLSGFVVTRLNWRWVFWHQVIALGVVMLAIVVFFQETRGSVLLARKAAAINKFLEEQEGSMSENEKSIRRGHPTRYRVPSEVKMSIASRIYLSVTIPFRLLFTEPVVFFFSLWAAFAWGVLYMTLSVLPLVFQTNHGFDTQQTGAVFASLVIGVILILIVSIVQEKVAKRYHPKLLSVPEGRLFFTCVESALLPIGLFWFGWTSFPSIPWIVPCMGIACAIMGIFSIYLAVFNYLADTYHRYASSALACQSFCRNILAAVFPLFSQQLFKALGYPGASSLLGGIAALLTIVPWVLVFKGEKIRSKSKVASQIMDLHG